MASIMELLLLNLHDDDIDDDSDDEEEVQVIPVPLRRRTMLTRLGHDAFLETERQFKKNYRLTKGLCQNLIEILRPYLKDAQRSCDLNIQTKVLIALNFFATGSYQTPVGLHLSKKVSQAAVSNCIEDVVKALNSNEIFREYVKFPSTFEALDNIARQFYHLYGLPGIVGVIDCTHVALFPPSSQEYDERSYVNRKGQHTVNTQLICDSNMHITNVNALFPGSTHDTYIWNQSTVLPLMQALHARGHTAYYLIGDSGYALRPWLHVPIPEPAEGTPEFRYNKAFKVARATIERCNGLLKGRFRCLRKEQGLHYSPEKVSKIIIACVVLHNMCVSNNVDLEDDDDDVDEFAEDLMDLPPLAQPGGRNQDLLRGRAMQQQIINNYF